MSLKRDEAVTQDGSCGLCKRWVGIRQVVDSRLYTHVNVRSLLAGGEIEKLRSTTVTHDVKGLLVRRNLNNDILYTHDIIIIILLTHMHTYLSLFVNNST